MLSLQQLTTAPPAQPERVELLGDCVYVRRITLPELLPVLKLTDEVARNSQVISLCVCDEAGARVFPTSKEARAFLQAQPANVSLALLQAINKLMPMAQEAVEQAEKNSQSSQS